MGRPSLAELRRNQMLAAIATCIAKHGLAASTQEVMASESGFSRSHIRHYLGNRDQVVEAVWDFMMKPYWDQMSAALASPDPEIRISRMLDFLFGPEMERKPEDVAIQALINGAASHPHLREKVEQTYLELERQVATQLRSLDPSVSARAAGEAAFGIMSMAFGAATFSDMGFPTGRRLAARRIARGIADDLTGLGSDLDVG